jgi:hypothetical protein
MNWADLPLLGAFFAKKNHTQKIGTIIPEVIATNFNLSSVMDYSYNGKIIDVTIVGPSDVTKTISSAQGWKDGDWVILRIVNSNGYVITYAGGGTLTATNDKGKFKQSEGCIYAEVVGTNVRLTGTKL